MAQITTKTQRGDVIEVTKEPNGWYTIRDGHMHLFVPTESALAISDAICSLEYGGDE